MYSKERQCEFKRQWGLYAYAIIIISLVPAIRGNSSEEGCTLRSDDRKEAEQPFLKRLEPLKGKEYNVTVYDSEGRQKYLYSIGICTAVGKKKEMAGAVQYLLHSNQSYNLGLINNTEVLGGDVWISLQYGEGENYDKHCSKQPRFTNIMIICDESADIVKLNFVEERNQNGTSQCLYLFELNTRLICPEKKEKLSTGSVICLIIIPCCGIYLLLGFLYRRVVGGAKGLEQIPNYAFWQDFGNLQADGCDFICRCGSRQQSQAYRGIDDCLDREEEERDDQLLAM